MKHWINKNYKTLIITAFLIPIITVAIVSISHVTKWYGISNPVTWAVYLSIGIEIAALSALAAISADMGKKVYFPFGIVTLIQFIGNIFFAYQYINIDSLVYVNKLDLMERVQSKKNLIKILVSNKPETVKESINIPLKSMVSIANQTMNGYLENLDEASKKEFIQLMSEDTNSLKEKFETLRESTIGKLNTLLENEHEFEIQTKLSETIDRLKVEKFDQLSFLKLKNLEESI